MALHLRKRKTQGNSVTQGLTSNHKRKNPSKHFPDNIASSCCSMSALFPGTKSPSPPTHPGPCTPFQRISITSFCASPSRPLCGLLCRIMFQITAISILIITNSIHIVVIITIFSMRPGTSDHFSRDSKSCLLLSLSLLPRWLHNSGHFHLPLLLPAKKTSFMATEKPASLLLLDGLSCGQNMRSLVSGAQAHS